MWLHFITLLNVDWLVHNQLRQLMCYMVSRQRRRLVLYTWIWEENNTAQNFSIKYWILLTFKVFSRTSKVQSMRMGSKMYRISVVWYNRLFSTTHVTVPTLHFTADILHLINFNSELQTSRRKKRKWKPPLQIQKLQGCIDHVWWSHQALSR